MATEECVVESRHFFLMQHEVYTEKAPNVIVDASGKLVSTEIRKGLDEDARKKDSGLSASTADGKVDEPEVVTTPDGTGKTK